MYGFIVRRRGLLRGLPLLAIGACFVGQSLASPATAPKDARQDAARPSWGFLTDADPGVPVNAGAAIAFLTLGTNEGAGFAVDRADGLEELGSIVRVQFGPELPIDDGTGGQTVDAGHWMVASRTTAVSATLVTDDGRLLFTWGFRSTTTLTPAGEFGGDPVTANHFRPMGMVATPMDAESVVVEIARRLPEILGAMETQAPEPITCLTPTGGWSAYWQCLQSCTAAGYIEHFNRFLTCLQVAGILTGVVVSACYVICGFIVLPCIAACLGIALPAPGTAGAACVAAYLGGLPLIAPACAIFCW